MKQTRLFEILYLLLEHKTLTARELAKRFEVSTRTIYRDIDILCEAGIPIYTTAGKQGGIHIMDSFILNKSIITEQEQNQILIALENLPPSMNNRKTLDKLKSIFQKSNTSWIEVDYSRWGFVSEDKSKFNIIRDSILTLNVIHFQYLSSNGTKTKRQIEPLKLVFKSMSWYLQGYCLARKDYRTFKLNRMHEVIKSEKKFSFMHTNISSIDVFKYDNMSNLTDIVLKFSECVSYRVYDEFHLRDIEKNHDGSYTVYLKFTIDDWLLSYILSFGECVEVIAPKELKDKIKTKVQKIFEAYN